MSLKDAIQRLVREEVNRLPAAGDPETLAGHSGVIEWGGAGAGGGGGEASTAPPAEIAGPLVEIPGTRTYHDPVQVLDDYGSNHISIRPLATCQVQDANGAVFTVNFDNPYA